MGKKYLSKQLREALQAVWRLSARDYEQLLAWQPGGRDDWGSLSDLVTWGRYVVPRGWPAPSGTYEELSAQYEAELAAERKLERERYRAERDERRRRRDSLAALDTQKAGEVH